jgi:hypothetical protein
MNAQYCIWMLYLCIHQDPVDPVAILDDRNYKSRDFAISIQAVMPPPRSGEDGFGWRFCGPPVSVLSSVADVFLGVWSHAFSTSQGFRLVYFNQAPSCTCFLFSAGRLIKRLGCIHWGYEGLCSSIHYQEKGTFLYGNGWKLRSRRRKESPFWRVPMKARLSKTELGDKLLRFWLSAVH